MTNLSESLLWLQRADDTLHASDVNLKNVYYSSKMQNHFTECQKTFLR
jgi:hypothetical protein